MWAPEKCAIWLQIHKGVLSGSPRSFPAAVRRGFCHFSPCQGFKAWLYPSPFSGLSSPQQGGLASYRPLYGTQTFPLAASKHFSWCIRFLGKKSSFWDPSDSQRKESRYVFRIFFVLARKVTGWRKYFMVRQVRENFPEDVITRFREEWRAQIH